MTSDDAAGTTAFREPGEYPIPFADALDAWAPVARDFLIETARVYGSLLTQAELASKVQSETGIRAGRPVRLWIDDLLAAVTRLRTDDEPLLASLCVRLDESVGDAYLHVLDVAGRATPEDPDRDAAVARFDCYVFAGAAMPPGAKPVLAPCVAERRAARKPARATTPRKTAAPKGEPKPKAAAKPKAAKPAKQAKPLAPEDRPPRLCPTCFTALPATGRCGYCD
ncbi:hypothetical protein nbrc107696_07840 [Gordonia spumicola]|uniref:Uncharacterized protein n=1 Tax=Gordonia spumicola TaxID=589161 RepID=A0A7I9V4J5_9ACTN|nr:hypothetical protein [Gordonia spumicola]GEE00338.1 hypothetical protein nbrc107696_07840 [Gordonia spumicola]